MRQHKSQIHLLLLCWTGASLDEDQLPVPYLPDFHLLLHHTPHVLYSSLYRPQEGMSLLAGELNYPDYG